MLLPVIFVHLKNVMMAVTINIIDINDGFLSSNDDYSIMKCTKTITRRQIFSSLFNVFKVILLVSILRVRQIFSSRYIMTHELLTHGLRGMRVDGCKCKIVDACVFKQCQVLFCKSYLYRME